MELLPALATALWLGILTSISPCPMATNIAAISFISRRIDSPRKVLLTGLLYTVGRTLTYVVFGILLAASLFSALMCDILVLPALVMLLQGAGQLRQASEELQPGP